MVLADAVVELCAGLLFGAVSLLMLRSLHRAGTLRRGNTLALALVSVFAVSAPHRLLRGVRLLLALRGPNAHAALVFPEGIAVDALVLGALAWYASVFTRAGRVLIPGERERFALFADQVGLNEVRAEMRALGDQARLDRARVAVLAEHLRQTAAPLEHLRREALTLAEESHDTTQRERLRELAAGVVAVEQLARIAG